MGILHFHFSSFFLLICIFLLSACGTEQSLKTGHAPRIVTQKVSKQDIQNVLEFPGRVSAIMEAEVRPQVGGIVTERLFSEGSHVTAGEALYRIDPKEYQTAYDKANGELLLAKADLEAVEKRVARQTVLLKSKAVSQQDFDDSRAELARTKARIATMEAALDEAALNLERTTLRAPISGFIGKSNISQGALVVAAQSEALAIIRDLETIYMDVKMPVTQWLELRSKLKNEGHSPVSLCLIMENGNILANKKTGNEIKGEIIFTDMEVNLNTGTINTRTCFPNPDELVPHGMYGRLKIEETIEQAILIPTRAIRHDISGNPFIFVMTQNPTGDSFITEKRFIITDLAIGNKTLVRKGLNEGDIIVIDGSVDEGQEIPSKNMLFSNTDN